jgi:hypothetical protein
VDSLRRETDYEWVTHPEPWPVDPYITLAVDYQIVQHLVTHLRGLTCDERPIPVVRVDLWDGHKT